MTKDASYICPECGDAVLRDDSLPRCRRCRIRLEYAGGLHDIQRLQRLPKDERIRLANSDDLPKGR